MLSQLFTNLHHGSVQLSRTAPHRHSRCGKGMGFHCDHPEDHPEDPVERECGLSRHSGATQNLSYSSRRYFAHGTASVARSSLQSTRTLQFLLRNFLARLGNCVSVAWSFLQSTRSPQRPLHNPQARLRDCVCCAVISALDDSAAHIC